MKRSSRVQTMITPLHRKKLDNLTKKYGTMNEVIERAIDLLEQMEESGPDQNVDDEISELRRKSDLFDALSSFSGFVLVRSSTIDSLFDVVTEGLSLNDFLQDHRHWAAEDIEIQKAVTRLARNYSKTFVSLVEIIQQVSDTFRSFYVLTSNEAEKKIIIHPNCFQKFPEIIGTLLQGILAFLEFEITYEIMDDQIILEWQEFRRNKKFTDNLITINDDSRFGLFKTLYGKLKSFAAEESKSENEIFKEIIDVASTLEIPKWNKGVFITGNRRFTYIPQELLIDYFNDLAVVNSPKLSEMLNKVSTYLLEIVETPSPDDVQSFLLKIQLIFCDYLGWGRFTILNYENDLIKVSVQYPILNTDFLINFLDNLLSKAGYHAVPLKTIDQGYYRSEFLIKK